MADRLAPIHKTPGEILTDLMEGHNEALYDGPEKGKKYLVNFSERNNSIPNSVKFYLYDLLVEDAYKCDDVETCRSAVEKAEGYLPTAQEEMPQRFREYSHSLRLFERGISIAIDEGEFERALALCDRAIGLGFGRIYSGKKASIERMM